MSTSVAIHSLDFGDKSEYYCVLVSELGPVDIIPVYDDMEVLIWYESYRVDIA